MILFIKCSETLSFLVNTFYAGIFEDNTTMSFFQIGVERTFRIVKKVLFWAHFVCSCLHY